MVETIADEIMREFNIDTPVATIVQSVANNTIQTTINSSPSSSTDSSTTDVEAEEVNPTMLVEAIEEHLEEVDTKKEDTPNIHSSVDCLFAPNPPIYINDRTIRFSGAEWFNAVKSQDVILAGLGGIGSGIAYLLSRMDINQLFMYDDDIVEMQNLAGQMYSKEYIGRKKTSSMGMLCESFSDFHKAFAIDQKFTKDTQGRNIMICGFDNMQARKDFFTSWKRVVDKSPKPEECLLIDGRLSMESFQVFTLTGNNTVNIKKYQDKYLFSDSEADTTICSMKQTAYCANMISSVIVNIFTNFVANLIKKSIPREVPFKVFYDAETMYFKIEN